MYPPSVRADQVDQEGRIVSREHARRTMTTTAAVRQLIGHHVDVSRRDGGRDHGMLLSSNGRSLWLVRDEEDVIILMSDIEDLRAAS
jgi:hypothetical protein